jgi:DinB superfamily
MRTLSRDSLRTTTPEITLLLRLLDESYEKKAWHGPNLRGSLRGVEVHEAAWRPAAGRHNIWENVVHAAYWKYTVRRRLLGEKKGSFPLKGSNWFVRPIEATADAWRADLALLDRTHRSLRAAVAELTPAQLAVTPAGSKVGTLAVLTGIAAHDVYHAGQIQLLKRLARAAGFER